MTIQMKATELWSSVMLYAETGGSSYSVCR